jgi:hypothetical protein
MSYSPFVVVMLGLLSGCQGIRMAQPPSKCPDISDNENVLFWGMILDGKDHSKGKHVYDWHGFDEAYKALDFLMKTKPDAPLEYSHLMKARQICCNSKAGQTLAGRANLSIMKVPSSDHTHARSVIT